MITIIAGSRTLTMANMKDIEAAIEESGFDITTVMCGCSNGADTLGEMWANEHDIPVRHVRADWDTFKKFAGPVRNRIMADAADALILVWDGKSPGSKNMLENGIEFGLRIFTRIVIPGTTNL